MHLFKRHVVRLLACMACGSVASSAAAVDLIWNFDAPNPLAPSVGVGSIGYYDPNATGWGPLLTQFGTPAGFGLPAFSDGGVGSVMKFPAATPSQGYKVTHNAGSLAQSYTMIWDYLSPAASDGQWRNLYQTSPTNSNDGELFIHNSPSGGIGIGGVYTGSIAPNVWNRIAVTRDASGTMSKYINGAHVGTQSATGGRFELDPFFYIFTDDNNENAAGFVSSFRFADSVFSADEIRMLGDVHSAGAGVAGVNVPAPPAPPPLPPGGRTMIVAHRGASAHAPENTIAALNLALQSGADVIESDVHLTADGVAIVFHDSTLERTTNGSGPIANLTLAQVKALDAGSWFGPEFAGEKAPTLAEHLLAAKGKALVYLDVKVSPNTAFRNAVFAALDEADMSIDDIWVWPGGSSYSNDSRIGNAEIQMLNYVPADLSDANLQALKASGVRGTSVTLGSVTQQAINAFNRNGLIFDVYTINDAATIQQLIRMGVGAIETDYPELMRQYIVPVPGDENLDDTVDIFDVAVVSNHWGQGGPQGDANDDGVVDIFDVAVVSSHWGLGFGNPGALASSSSAAVPEPSAAALAGLGLVAVLGRGGRRWFAGRDGG